jgi:GNAT superfamily N-acetyltransferase
MTFIKNQPMDLEYTKGGLKITTDKSKLNLEFIKECLDKTYWAKGIPGEVVKTSIENSITYGVFEDGAQVGFARVVTDKATFAYLADVIIDDKHQGNGLAKWMMECIMQNPSLQNLRLFLLATRDAHKLYGKFGFKPVGDPERFMEIFNPGIYSQSIE